MVDEQRAKVRESQPRYYEPSLAHLYAINDIRLLIAIRRPNDTWRSGKLDGGSTSFTFDETDAAYIKLDTVAFANEGSSIGHYIVEDIAHYITCRKPKEKKVLIIIDEVSALAIENIANLSERLRSSKGAMMLTTQSEEGLAKTLDERTRILKTSHMLILHTCNTPERLVERAGKYKQIHTGWSVRDQEGTGYGIVHISDEYIVPPD